MPGAGEPVAGPPRELPTRLAARGLTLGYGGTPVVHALDLEVPTGAVTAVVGPNGCGKSTLLHGLARLAAPMSGRVELDGSDLARLPGKRVARTLGVLPQAPTAPEGLTVADLVARGRHPHQSWFAQWSRDDERAVADVLARVGLADLADRRLDELSGGQRQRAWIAMVLAQGTDLLLLDEPTTYLDLAHAVEVLDLVRDLNRTDGRTVVMVLHDLTLAARYAEHVVVMHEGRIAAQGRPCDVITPQLLASAFDLTAHVVQVEGCPVVVPVGLAGCRC